MNPATATILWRVCWNDCGWQKPSGGFKEAGYPADNGFGHEEWNFRLDDAVDDWVYGYVYKTKLKRAGAFFRIVFFAIDPNTKERIVVGIYHAAEFIAAEDREKIAAAFRRRGIFRRRAAELRRATGKRYSQREAFEFVRNAVSDPVLMVRCHVKDIEIPKTRIPLHLISGEQSVGHRFKSFTYLEDSAYFGGPSRRVARPSPSCMEPALVRGRLERAAGSGHKNHPSSVAAFCRAIAAIVRGSEGRPRFDSLRRFGPPPTFSSCFSLVIP